MLKKITTSKQKITHACKFDMLSIIGPRKKVKIIKYSILLISVC